LIHQNKKKELIMSHADLILSLLDKQRIEFEALRAPDMVCLKDDWLQNTVPLHSVGRVAVMEDEHGLILAIFPADHLLNLDDLQAILHRSLNYIEDHSVMARLLTGLKNPQADVDAQHGLQIILDAELTDQDYIHFEAPTQYTVLRVKSLDMGNLAGDVLLGGNFSDVSYLKRQESLSPPRLDIRKRIAQFNRLPGMPDLPGRILAIRNNANSTVDDLIPVIENNLLLSAQILRYSNSAMFKPVEPITSLRDAVCRVLGYETAVHFCLAYSLGRVFKLPAKGRLGHENYWKHAIYSAALAQQLAAIIPRDRRPHSGLIYACGLLHDVGFQVINLFFKHEFAWLNKLVTANPNNSILNMEQQLLGASHNEIGEWLLQSWNIPAEICITVAQHHNLDYRGPYAEYALLLNLCERLLKMHGMSDSDTDEIPRSLLRKLGLDEEEVFVITDEVLQGGEVLTEMAVAVST